MTKPHLHTAETWRHPQTMQRVKVWPQKTGNFVLDVYEYRQRTGKFLTALATSEEARDYLTRGGFVRAA